MSGGAAPELELRQIQGLVLSGYGDRPAARYAVFSIRDPERVRRFLGELAPRLQYGEYRKTPRHVEPRLASVCMNIAFSHAGFAALDLHPLALSGFSLPFQEGMCEPNRARRLGDDGPSDPSGWAWGRAGQPVHGVLAVFGPDPTAQGYAALGDLVASNVNEANGLELLTLLDTTPADPVLRREHFGFRDGITNPRLASLSHGDPHDVVADGEILLGYENGYGHMPMSPEVPENTDPARCLAAATDRRERRDFGRNGSYLVFRQLAQNVRAFWEHVYKAKDTIPGVAAGREGAEWLASRYVGRWPNGTLVTRYPHHPGPDQHEDQKRFLYYEKGDSFGTRCPIGSHIRRTNPRDTALPAPYDVELCGTPEEERVRQEHLKLTALHRIMRRGRQYGPAADPACDPDQLRQADDRERGLHFLCFNANLGRQFEFVQSNWALSPTFGGLARDPDPLLAAQRRYPFPASDFTIQGCPTRRVHGIPRVVEVRGGAYFFMPSRGALEYLATARR
jgi:Dyp-type peroxidase family